MHLLLFIDTCFIRTMIVGHQAVRRGDVFGPILVRRARLHLSRADGRAVIIDFSTV